MTLPINIRICDFLPSAETDKAAFMQGLCDVLSGHLRAAGAKGGEIEDAIWLPGGDDMSDGAIVIARPAINGFGDMSAGRCRQIIAEKIAAAKASNDNARSRGRLL